MKKTIVVFLIIAMTAVLTAGCSGNKPGASAHAASQGQIEEGWDLSRSADAAPIIFEGICERKSTTDNTGFAEMSVHAERVLRGDIKAGETCSVSSVYPDVYKDGERYLLFVVPTASVYSGRQLYYSADTVIYQDENGAHSPMIPDLEFDSLDKVVETVETYVKEHEYKGGTEVLGAYCDSESIADACAFSNCIVKAVPESVVSDDLADRTVYVCRVDSVLKGEADDSIMVVAFKNGMQPGVEYLLLLTKPGEDSSIYAMSSPLSIAEADTPAAQEILSLVG